METLATYFQIGGKDFSHYVKSLVVESEANYTSQTNAAGDTVVDYVNTKRTITVVIIPLTAAQMLELKLAIKPFNVSISFMNPETNTLEYNVNCIIPSNGIEYFTIQTKKTMFQEAELTFTEL